MRSLVLALAVVGTGFAFQSAPAQAREAAFCLQGKDTSGGRGDCSYTTYQQCQARASGTWNGCYANPYVTYDDEPVYPTRRRSYRSYY